MRALFLVVCLALARDGVSNIVRHKFSPQLLSLDVRSGDYVDQHQRDKERKPSHSVDSTSQETRERYTYDDISDYPSPVRSSKNWNSPLYSVITQSDQVPYGDVIELHGVQIAAEPNSPNSEWEHMERITHDAMETIDHITEEDNKKVHEVFVKAHEKEHHVENLNATQLIKKHHYGVEEHIVKTDDGYFLTLFRIQPKQVTQDIKNRPVVFLMHGILGSADDFLLMGPKKSLAYLLSDAGYDVWLGNTRGNKYSRHHASKHVSNPDFWQFSIDEIALHDLPTMIDYVLEVSGQEKMFYVGHSQGSTILFALAATRPEYAEKITVMHALSPMVYMSKTRSPLLRIMAPNSYFYKRLHAHLPRGEFTPSTEVVKAVGGDMCKWKIGCEHTCSNMNFVMTGFDTTGMDFEILPEIVQHLPAGAAIRQIEQYGQAVAAKELRKFDYGSNINEMIYGHPEPPKYNMTEVKLPVALYYSEADWLAHPDDVARLHGELPHVTDYYKVPEKHFTHMDFQFSRKAPELVYNRLLESIKKQLNN